MAAALERRSEHPIARALRAGTLADDIAVAGLRAKPGAGIEAELAGRVVRLGRLDYVAELHGEALPAAALAKVSPGETAVALGDASGWLAIFRLGDRIREDAASMTASLRETGLKLAIFSGDATATAAHVGRQLGIDDARGDLDPEAKHAALKEMQAAGAVVAMAGDGVNDAPVLARAQVSVAMGGGADLARASADVVLLGNNLLALAEGVETARATLRIVRQNLGWSLAYNLVAIPLAMFGLVTPWMAGIGMSASSLLVVLNALRLQRRKSGHPVR